MIKIEKVEIYKTGTGKEPIVQWVNSLDGQTQYRIKGQINRIKLGYLGDWKSLGCGIYEVRMQFGAGYRIYYALEARNLILLLCGGDKSSQKKDIAKAKEYLTEYQRRSV